MDAYAVVAHANALHAGVLDIDAHVRSGCIQAVLQQFLDDGSRPLHHFARRNLIGHELAERPNARAQLPLPLPDGINNTWPTRMRSPAKRLTARRLPVETRLRWAISDNVSPRLIT